MTGNDTPENGERKAGLGFEPWPDWNVWNVAALARYVSVAALDETGLTVPNRYSVPDAGWASGEAVARAVYEGIRGLKLTYTHQPWRREGYGITEAMPKQRVRYPAWVIRDSGGTCLDLAVLYASALMRAQIRPYIAVKYDSVFTPIHGEQTGHAFVVADLRAPLTARMDEADPSGVLEKAGNGLARIRFAAEWPRYLLTVDPMCATAMFPLNAFDTSDDSVEFSRARAKASEYLDDERIWLCDVAAAQAGDYPPLGLPADNATPAIWTRLPEMPDAKRYPSRTTQHDKVMETRGRIVVYGARGFGKSTLASARARAADGGYGWWLNAADRSALQSELAQAEIGQRARGYQQPLEKPDRVPFSEAARRRLEVSDAPWVLVLDNANGDPRDLEDLLPREIGENQTIIITTTNDEGWRRLWPVSMATHVRLDALNEEDMPTIPGELRDRVGGSPLFYEAARVAVISGARVPADPGSDAGLVWQLARDFLAGEPGALDLAHLLAWAPPVALPVAKFAKLTERIAVRDGELAGPGRLLDQAGLARFLTWPDRALLMHGLIAERIRQDERLIEIPGHPPLPAPVALAATDAGQRLMTDHGDAATFARLEALLSSAPPPGVPSRSWGLAAYGVARAGEIRGRSEPSSALFEQAIGLLDAKLDRSELSECWNGRARYTKDHPPADKSERIAALAEALSWAQRAEDLAREAADSALPDRGRQLWDLIRAERAHAMRALIIRAASGDAASPDEEKAELVRSLEMLKESEAKRLEYLHEIGISDSPDMDRSRFNLGGLGIRLAKLSHGAEAEKYLREGLAAYEAAKRIRVARHGEGVALPAIASCDFGIALAYYYGALLAADPLREETEEFRPVSPQARMTLLRRATTAAVEALRDRSVLAPADRDDPDAVKSDDLMIKIVEVRKLLSAQHARDGASLSPADAEKVLAKTEAEARAEARDLGGIVAADDANG